MWEESEKTGTKKSQRQKNNPWPHTTCNTDINTWEPNPFGTLALCSQKLVKLVPLVHKCRGGDAARAQNTEKRHQGKVGLWTGHQQINRKKLNWEEAGMGSYRWHCSSCCELSAPRGLSAFSNCLSAGIPAPLQECTPCAEPEKGQSPAGCSIKK